MRPFDDDDAAAVYRYASTPGIDAHVHWQAHASIEDSLAYIQTAVDRARRHVGLAVTLGGDVIGSVGFTSDAGGHVSLGYVIGQEHAGQGFATEVLQAATELALTLPGVDATKAFIQEANLASRRVAEKVGYVDERVARADEVPAAACIGARAYVYRA